MNFCLARTNTVLLSVCECTIAPGIQYIILYYILYTGWSRYERKRHRDEERERERERGGGGRDIPYPRKRGPTTECRPSPHFGLNFLLRSSVYSNMHPCVTALESAAQMHEMAGLYFE